MLVATVARAQATFLLALALSWLDHPRAILPLLLVVAPLNVACNGGGYAVNHLDIAPQLASLVLAFYNMGGQVMGWMTPWAPHRLQPCTRYSAGRCSDLSSVRVGRWAIGALTPYPDGMSREQIELSGGEPSAAWVASLSREWRSTFLLGGLCNLAGAAFYLWLADDRVQPWSKAWLASHADADGGAGGGGGGSAAPSGAPAARHAHAEEEEPVASYVHT